MSYWHTDYHTSHLGLAFEVSEVLYTEQSPYQKIEVVQTPGFGKVLLLDGVLMLTERDEFTYHEMLTQPSLFTHPNPEKVLIVGGGDCGTLTRVLQHPGVKRAVMVELDERVTRVSNKYFPQLGKAASDPRAEQIFTDGIIYMAETQEKFDLILIDSTDPIGPAVALFQAPFFKDCHRVLNDDGILCLQSESPWVPELEKIISDVNRDLHSLFPIVRIYGAAVQTYQAGFWLFQIGSKKYDPLDPKVAERIDKVAPNTKYYNRDLHFGAFMLPTFVNDLLN